MAIETVELGPVIGVELVGIKQIRDLLDRTVIDRCLKVLKRHGVLVIRGIHLDDQGQLAFSRSLGKVFAPEGRDIYTVKHDPTTFKWHVDGCTPDIPSKYGVLTARHVAMVGGGTEFANTYAAYESMPGRQRKRFEGLRVLHRFEAIQRGVVARPSKQELAHWRSLPTHESWLVWKRQDGRTSLVITASVDEIIGLPADESRALLDELLAWATQERFRYVHDWQVGDVVVWDNTGILHRAHPYDASSGRILHRTAIEGTEAWS